MLYIKSFNESNEYWQVDDTDIRSSNFSEEEYIKISDFLYNKYYSDCKYGINRSRFIKNENSITMHFGPFNIYKSEDEWYYVFIRTDKSTKIYQCDQLNGLFSFFENEIHSRFLD